MWRCFCWSKCILESYKFNKIQLGFNIRSNLCAKTIQIIRDADYNILSRRNRGFNLFLVEYPNNSLVIFIILALQMCGILFFIWIHVQLLVFISVGVLERIWSLRIEIFFVYAAYIFNLQFTPLLITTPPDICRKHNRCLSTFFLFSHIWIPHLRNIDARNSNKNSYVLRDPYPYRKLVQISSYQQKHAHQFPSPTRMSNFIPQIVINLLSLWIQSTEL